MSAYLLETCRRLHIDAYAERFANDKRVPQVVWYSPTVDAYGRTPLPEWNQKRYEKRVNVVIVKVIQPKGTS